MNGKIKINMNETMKDDVADSSSSDNSFNNNGFKLILIAITKPNIFCQMIANLNSFQGKRWRGLTWEIESDFVFKFFHKVSLKLPTDFPLSDTLFSAHLMILAGWGHLRAPYRHPAHPAVSSD